MRRYIILLVTLVVATSLMLVGCGKAETQQNKAAAKGNRPAGGMKIVQVMEGSIAEKTTLTGTLEALNSANVVAKTSGKVASITVDIGSRVSAGQTLMTLEADDLAASVTAAEASLETAQINYDLSQKKYSRGKELLRAAAISQAEFEENYEGTLRKSEAAVKSARAALAQSQARFKETILQAPLTGVVTARNINEGELANSANPLFSISNLDKVVVKVNVNEQQVNQLAEGQLVSVKVSAVSTKDLSGVVSNIALAADSKTKAFPIKIQLANPDHILKPGMFAEVSIDRKTPQSLLVPRTAVATSNGQTKVFVLENETVRERKVETGDSDGENICILAGLNKGDQVIIGNFNNLKDGAKVRPPDSAENPQGSPQKNSAKS